VRPHAQDVGGRTRAGTGHQVVGRQLHKSDHLRVPRVPEVDGIAESHCQQVSGGPVDQVEVEVVVEGGRVEDLGGDLANLTVLLLLDGEVVFGELKESIVEVARVVLGTKLLFVAA
jgi:hypothetical protein